MFKNCVLHNIKLESEWIPREENQLADYYSSIIDYDDWYIDRAVFEMLEAAWAPHTVDRFATAYNAQMRRFNSHYACPGSEAVDAFTTANWFRENNWWCPLPVLVPRVLRHAERCKAQGTLVIPGWESAPFWPLLYCHGDKWASFVMECKVLPLSDQLIRPGQSGSTLFNGKFPNMNVLAMRLNFGLGKAGQ